MANAKENCRTLEGLKCFPSPPFKKAVLTEYGLIVESAGREVVQFDPDGSIGRRFGYCISIKQNGILFDRVIATSDSVDDLIALQRSKSGGHAILLGAYIHYSNN